MLIRRLAIVAVTLIGGAVMAGNAAAQGPNYNNFARDYIRNRPTVSPYLNLVQLGNRDGTFSGTSPIYQTLVRPQIEAREEARQQNLQINQIQRQLSAARRDSAQQQQGRNWTGHPTRFVSYLHYYPGLGR